MLCSSLKHFRSSRARVLLLRCSLAISPGSEGPRAAELPVGVCRRFSVQGEGSTAAARSGQGGWSRGAREAVRGVTPSRGALALPFARVQVLDGPSGSCKTSVVLPPLPRARRRRGSALQGPSERQSSCAYSLVLAVCFQEMRIRVLRKLQQAGGCLQGLL